MLALLGQIFLVVCALASTGCGLKIGCLIPWTGWAVGNTITGAADIAVKEINDSGFLGGERLEIIYGDSQCSPGTATGVSLRFFNKEDIDVLIGPGCSTACEATNYVANYYNIPQISWGCASSTLSNKGIFPTFTRTVNPYSNLGPLFSAFFAYNGWTHCSILHSTESIWSAAGQQLAEDLPAAGIDVVSRQSFEPGGVVGVPGTKAPLLQSILDSRVHIIIVFTYAGDFRDIMLTAADLGMTGAGWVYLGNTLEVDFLRGETDWMGDDGRNADAFKAADGCFSAFTAIPTTPEYHRLEDEVRQVMAKDYNVPSDQLTSINSAMGYLYDAVYLYAHAVKFARENDLDIRNGTLMRDVQIENVKFDGITGLVDIDKSGDMLASFDVGNFRYGDPKNPSITLVGTYFYERDAYVPNGERQIFPGGLTEPPIDVPPPDKFQRSSVLEWIFFSLAVLGIVVTVAVGVFILANVRNKVIVYTQPVFVGGMLLGNLLGYSYVVLLSFTPDTPLCVAQLWVGHFAFLFTFAPLLGKTWRIATIFQSAGSFKQVTFPAWRVWVTLGVVAAPLVMYLVVWSAVDTFKSEEVETNDAGTEIYYNCESSASWWQWVLFGCEGAGLILGLALLLYARNVPVRFSEARLVGFSMANIFLVALVAIVVVSVVDNQPNVDLIIKSIAMLFGITFVMAMVLIPKIFFILVPQKDHWTTGAGSTTTDRPS